MENKTIKIFSRSYFQISICFKQSCQNMLLLKINCTGASFTGKAHFLFLLIGDIISHSY